MRLRRWYLAAVSLLVLLYSGWLVFGQEPQAGQPLEVTVVAVKGSVEVKLTAEADWQPAQEGMKLPVGATVCTGVMSRVDLDFDGHAVVVIRRPSIVRVDRFLLSDKAVETRLHLTVGSMRAGVVKEQIASDFKISTPEVTLSTRGTEIADVTHSERGTEVRMGEEGLLDMTKYFSPLGITRGIPPHGYSRSSDLIQVVDAAKLHRTLRSYLFGRDGAEDHSAQYDPNDLEDSHAENNREAGHPEFGRVLFQDSILNTGVCWPPTPRY
jgi:hypothetical protein